MKKQVQKQLSLFENQRNKDQSSFDLGVKQPKKKSLYREVATFCLLTGGIWMSAYSVMNYNALSQLAEFKWQRIKTSLVQTTENIQEKFENTPQFLDTNVAQARKSRKNTKIKPKNNAPELFKNLEILPSDNRLYIPSIDRNIPLVDVPNNKNWRQLENSIQEGLRNGVVVHPVSHDPGNFGNFFLTGHSSYYAWDKGRYKDVFALLHEVEPGEEVHIFWEGKKYIYKLGEKKVVPPTEVSILEQPENQKQITLMTCTPIGTNKNRLVLQGELIEE